MRNAKRVAIGALMAAALVSAMPLTASASHGDGITKGGVTAKGKCSVSAKWKLSLRPEDPGMVRATLEVDETAPGSKWSIVMKDNGTQFFAKTKKANLAGNVRARKATADQAGVDAVTATATNVSTGEVCSAQASL